MSNQIPYHSSSSQEDIAEEQSIEEEFLKQYKVIIHNDHFTSMEFVVEVLMDFFEKDYQQAVRIMLWVHKHGSAVAGVYSREIAETKIHQTQQLAEKNQFPLRLTLEKVR